MPRAGSLTPVHGPVCLCVAGSSAAKPHATQLRPNATITFAVSFQQQNEYSWQQAVAFGEARRTASTPLRQPYLKSRCHTVQDEGGAVRSG